MEDAVKERTEDAPAPPAASDEVSDQADGATEEKKADETDSQKTSE